VPPCCTTTRATRTTRPRGSRVPGTTGARASPPRVAELRKLLAGAAPALTVASSSRGSRCPHGSHGFPVRHAAVPVLEGLAPRRLGTALLIEGDGPRGILALVALGAGFGLDRARALWTGAAGGHARSPTPLERRFPYRAPRRRPARSLSSSPSGRACPPGRVAPGARDPSHPRRRERVVVLPRPGPGRCEREPLAGARLFAFVRTPYRSPQSLGVEVRLAPGRHGRGRAFAFFRLKRGIFVEQTTATRRRSSRFAVIGRRARAYRAPPRGRAAFGVDRLSRDARSRALGPGHALDEAVRGVAGFRLRPGDRELRA